MATLRQGGSHPFVGERFDGYPHTERLEGRSPLAKPLMTSVVRARRLRSLCQKGLRLSGTGGTFLIRLQTGNEPRFVTKGPPFAES